MIDRSLSRAHRPIHPLSATTQLIYIMKRFLLTILAALLAAPLHLSANTTEQLEASIRASTTGAGSVDFTIAPPAIGAGQVVDAGAWGVKPGNTGGSNYTAFVNALNYCKANNSYKLTVPPGTYHLGNYGSSYGAILDFNGFTDFVFDGQGAQFLMEAKAKYIRLQNCQRVVLQNYTMDWNWALEPLQSLGQLHAIDPAGNYIDLLFPYESNPNASATVHEIVEVDSTNYNCSHKGMGIIGQWRLDFTKTTKPAANIIRYYQNASVNGNGWFNSQHGVVGQYYVTRHYEYEFHAFNVTDSNDITFTNAILYSTLGMGYYVSTSHHTQIIDSKLIRAPGSLWHYSSASDGLHVNNSYGYLKLQNFEISNAGDDAINIHDTCSQGVTGISGNTLVAKNCISWRNPYNVGDVVQFRKGDMSPAGFQSAVTSRTYNDGISQCTITFANAIPGGTDLNSVLFNQRYNSANYIIRNCYIHDNKVRGLITHCANGTIENNQFLRNFDAAMFIVCLATTYQEGNNPKNIIVRNNVFDGNDLNHNAFASMPQNVVIAGETASAGIVSYPICQNIIVENNLFKNCPYAALEVASATNILVANNTFQNPNLYNDLASVSGSLMVLKSSAVVLHDNLLIVDAGITSYKTNINIDGTATVDIFDDPFSKPVTGSWSSQDIGSVGLAGGASYSSGTFTAKGSGADIWGTSDSFQFVYQPWSGDGEIVVHVASVQNTDPWAKGAVMFRETLAADSRHGVLFVTPGNGVSLQGRTTTGGSSVGINTVAGIVPPRWLKLVRSGIYLNGYQSADGLNWFFVGTQTNSMNASI
ncbi:MAG: alpha-galactosidase, partial [Verrucomicrobiales bacterium]|nr:alpha-galactosidase [Verrucomicrobiales bacterium]